MAQAGQERLQRFCGLLAGRHSNQQQAFENPPFFAHIILKYRALPQFDQPTLLLEQGYAVDPSQPYRVRILRPTLQGETSIRVINFRLHELQRFQGASDDRMIRDTIAACKRLLTPPVCLSAIRQLDVTGARGALFVARAPR